MLVTEASAFVLLQNNLLPTLYSLKTWRLNFVLKPKLTVCFTLW
jgi:hypothetical protein